MFKITIFVVCVFAVVFLVGCGSSGDSARTALSDSVNDDGGSDEGDVNGDGGGLPHSPEPVTMALLGGGLFTYALLRRRNRRK